MGSEDAKSRGWAGGEGRGCSGIQWEAPVHLFATSCLRVCLFPSHFTAWGPKSPAAGQKGRSLLSYLLSEQKPTEGQEPSPPAQRNLTELPPQQPQTLLGSWPVVVLRAGLHCPCTSSRITPLLPSLSSVITNTTAQVPSRVHSIHWSQFHQHHHSASGQEHRFWSSSN